MDILSLKRRARGWVLRDDTGGDESGAETARLIRQNAAAEGGDPEAGGATRGIQQPVAGDWTPAGQEPTMGDPNQGPQPPAGWTPPPSGGWAGVQKDAVQGVVDQFGNPVYTGDTARAIQAGMKVDATGNLVPMSTAETLAGGMEVSKLREMLANGLIKGSDDVPGNPNQTVDQALGVIDRVNPALNAIGRAAQMAIGATMPAPMAIASSFARAYSKDGNVGDAAVDAAKNYLSGVIGGALNKQVAGAIGPEASGVLSNYNKVGSLVNAVTGDKTVNTINPGGYITNAMGLGGSVTGSSMPDGNTPIPSGGWSNDSRGSTAKPEILPPDSATTAGNSAQIAYTPYAEGILNSIMSSFRKGVGTLKKTGA